MLKFRKNCGHTVLLFYVGQASRWASKICPRVELLSLILEYCVKFLIKKKQNKTKQNKNKKQSNAHTSLPHKNETSKNE